MVHFLCLCMLSTWRKMYWSYSFSLILSTSIQCFMMKKKIIQILIFVIGTYIWIKLYDIKLIWNRIHLTCLINKCLSWTSVLPGELFITWTGIPTDATVGQKIVNSYLTIAGIVHCHITNSLGPSRILLLRTFMVLKKVVTLKRRDELMLFIKGLVVFSIFNLYSCNVKLIFTSLMETHFFVVFLLLLFNQFWLL